MVDSGVFFIALQWHCLLERVASFILYTQNLSELSRGVDIPQVLHIEFVSFFGKQEEMPPSD